MRRYDTPPWSVVICIDRVAPVYSERNKEVRRSDAALLTERQSLLLRVHKAAPPKKEIKAYEICELPDVVLPGLRREAQSGEMTDTKNEKSRKAIDHFHLSGGLQLYARRQKQKEFPGSTSMRKTNTPDL